VRRSLQCFMVFKSTATLSRGKLSTESEVLEMYMCVFSFLKLSWATQQMCGSASV
jgi:hypothetical protein